MTCILAIDPGISGAIAIYFTEAPDKVMVADMPLAGGDVNPHALRQMIEGYKPDFAIIEQVSPMPKEGVSSVWRFAAAYTTARVTVMLMNIPLVLVRPNIWKKAMMLTMGEGNRKEQSRVRALATFPTCAISFARKKDHNRAEAALLAVYAATTRKGLQYELPAH